MSKIIQEEGAGALLKARATFLPPVQDFFVVLVQHIQFAVCNLTSFLELEMAGGWSKGFVDWHRRLHFLCGS